MPSSTRFDPAKHPRGPLGRFIDTDQLTPSGRRPSERFRAAQGEALHWSPGADINIDPIDNAYKRGSLWSGTAITKLPDDVKAVGEDYQYSQANLNEPLRGGQVPADAAKMDRLIEANRLKNDTTVYRGVDGAVLAEASPGDQVWDRGYTSTSIDPGSAANFGNDVLEIELPAGTAVAPLDKLNSYEYGHQKELVVGRGAVLEIDSIEAQPGGWLPIDPSQPQRLVRARLVGYVEDAPPLKSAPHRVRHGSTEVTTKDRADGNLEITDIQTSSSSRGQGSGTAAMRATLAEADRAGRITVLVPEPLDKRTSKAKLEQWYRSLGFVPNRGATADPRVRGNHYWYRPPGGRS